MVVLLCENIVLLCEIRRRGQGHRADWVPRDPSEDFFDELARIIAVGGPNLSIVERSGAVKGG